MGNKIKNRRMVIMNNNIKIIIGIYAKILWLPINVCDFIADKLNEHILNLLGESNEK